MSAPVRSRSDRSTTTLTRPSRLDYPREKGCILILGRNEDEKELKSSLVSFENMASLRKTRVGRVLSTVSDPSDVCLSF